MTHYHLVKNRTTGNSSMSERIGAAWATEAEAQIMADREQMMTANSVKFSVDGPCPCPAPLNPESASRLLGRLQEQNEQILARQRDYGMHDPGCPTRLHEKSRKGTDMWLGEPPDCECWLANKGPDVD